MDIAVEKKEIIQWINSLDNPFIIEQIKRIRKNESEPFDFEREWKQGLSIDDARKKTADFIKSLPWKK
ncbi:hypothetical protein G5B30_01090 [Sphingobacterium sp. SGG-5]|uniref:hypothetical protein n=1 Tax=Sphingobacterium sp. SGG-5 TaxID=2710881 RepID=UPI0013EA55AF|nr:hypothetical protein [Sphingobacterium sp. SGG-5]NGM60498.1 hypothetical protein [Sphingobacterium sp. SGG-5]